MLWPVTMRPPSDSKYDARALAMACEPPRGMGQPTACPAAANSHPKAADPSASKRQQRVRGIARKKRARRFGAEQQPGQGRRRPNATAPRSAPSAMDGRARCSSGDWIIGTSSRQRRPTVQLPGDMRRRPHHRRTQVSSSDCASTAADPSSSGCARGSGGWIHSRPCCARGKPAKAGELAAHGCTAEQTSCTNPGSVSSAERVPPPMVGCASNTVVRSPACARMMAAVRPFGPEPTTHALLLWLGMFFLPGS